MSAVPDHSIDQFQSDKRVNSLSANRRGTGLFNRYRILWVALICSLAIHLLILAPHYKLTYSRASNKFLTVSFRTENQSAHSDSPLLKHQTPALPQESKSLRSASSRTLSTKTGRFVTNQTSTADLMANASISSSEFSNTTSNKANAPTGGRRITLTANMKDYRYSQYLSDWRNKVERIGAMNYPEEARGRFFGSLVLSVALRPDGTVDRITVVRSSGNKVLDDAAKKIVMIASPFAPFPEDIRKETDYLDITRTWNFTRSDTLETR